MQLSDLLARVRCAAAAGEGSDLPAPVGSALRAERDTRYQTALSRADRQTIVEILRDTKKDLPA